VGHSEADVAMERYAAGDDAALSDLYDQLAPSLHQSLRMHSRSPERVDAILEQTFDHIHRLRGTFIRGAEVHPWALAVAERLMKDAIGRDFKEARASGARTFKSVEKSLPRLEASDPALARMLSRAAVSTLSALFEAERLAGAARFASLRRAEAHATELRSLVDAEQSQSRVLTAETAGDVALLQECVAVLASNQPRAEGAAARPVAAPPLSEVTNVQAAPATFWERLWRRK
jgi:DNA-directed RNA polymerase specialized sigma24 family protein